MSDEGGVFLNYIGGNELFDTCNRDSPPSFLPPFTILEGDYFSKF